MKNRLTLSLLALLLVVIFACKKDAETPPVMELKTSAGYTSADKIVAPGDSLLVGVTVTKTEDEMETFNVSVAYDGATSTNTVENHDLAGADPEVYEKDVKFGVRNQAGTEKWYFTMTDADGNIAQKILTITVQ